MRITFQTNETEKQQIRTGQQGKMERSERSEHPGSAVFFAGNEDNWLQANSGKIKREKSKTLAEVQQEAGNIDAGVRQDYMTVMSNTMSEEDYAKLQEEGFHFESMDPEEAVTIVDKIKAELARSGQHIAGYTDDLDMETLAAAVGSDTLARSISDSFQSADIPLTEENLEGVKQAWDMASQLEAPGEGATHYMVDNQSETEIWDFYLAQSSGAESMTGSKPRYYAEDIRGYFTRSANEGYSSVQETQMQNNLQPQMDKVISEAGLELTEANRANASWLMSQGLPLTGENLHRMQEIQEIPFPVTEEHFAEAVSAAILKGNKPIHANLADKDNIYAKAVEITEKFWREAEALLETGDVTARRQLEEIRLRMTAEVNVKLLKSGFSIDTAPMEELLEALKQAEAQLAESYFPQDAQAIDKYQLYRQTNQTIEELPGMPAQVLGIWSLETKGALTTGATEQAKGTLAEFHQRGKALQEVFHKANESYEALMTAPRRDMGDSIRKAFANVDDILKDLQLEVNEQNRRAVRILGYNRMELTVENIELVRQTDEQVKAVISKMTPAATLQMIRDGVNPLEMSFPELEKYFDNQSEEYEEAAESYSRFLYHLEQNKEITAEEREAYIGIHRLLRQLEKSDGAAIGNVLNTGAELQFANLLSAVRSGKFRHMDIKVTGETGLLQDLVQKGSSISEQISEGMESSQKQYREMELEYIRQAGQTSSETYTFLAEKGIPVNVENLLATESLLKDAMNPFKKWREKTRDFEGAEKLIDAMNALPEKEELSEFAEGYRNTLQEVRESVEEITLEAESSVDVKAMQMVHKQLSVMTAMSDSREYIIPMYIGEELGRVHLTLKQGTEQKGMVSVKVDWAENAHGEAQMQVHEGKVSVQITGNTQEEVRKLQKAADIFHELLEEEGVSETPDTTELYHVARLFLKAMKE